ncbi:SpoVR family protein [Swaminathania salitolerans]|uniref:SpoVR family protein n=1 Tax=Swaminathania salitolerans TaxID=182838 RepID=A0A511BNW7_9PROT|nr:SpoVR family protein [Swaminathania salitolerans]GBQ14990.1 putative stage V sporulation protein R [Swaminathania salitolerans LMG 21291]GEL01955.1 SpoVR family protein [Swaminathania salitolerans]
MLYTGTDWTFATLRDCYGEIDRIASEELRLDTYPNRIELITSEQMLDVYTSHGMPISYPHWSAGKRFVSHENAYRKGLMGLAYEVVINSSPCISYLMEENTATMQALVIAHAAFGHNHFFKNNRLFREWTDATQILDYLEFARGYVARCEERYGVRAVERVLDAAHALQNQGVDRHTGSKRLDLRQEQERARERRAYEDEQFNDLWRTLPDEKTADLRKGEDADPSTGQGLPEENILYFLEKNAPRLANWEREIIRIVRLIAQYFYPQPQAKLMNEGCATWVHNRIMHRLHEKGLIDDAAIMETIHSTTNVITQRGFEEGGGPNFNPYALGFAMMTDIARVCTEPTEEDRLWFPGHAGNDDPIGTLHHAWSEYRDESFVQQFLSPKVIRDFRLFRIEDDLSQPFLLVDAIHDEQGYREIRRSVSASYDPGLQSEEIEIVGVDLTGDRILRLEHRTRPGQLLHPTDARLTLDHLSALWGYGVIIKEVDASTGAELGSYAKA